MTRAGPVELALRRSLKSVNVADADQVVAALARTYARSLDNPEELTRLDITRLGRSLQAALEALLMTPRERARVDVATPRKVTADAGSPLDQLRARRSARIDAS